MITTVIKQISNLIAELVIPIGIPTKKSKAEMETHSVVAEITISEWSTYFKTLETFLYFLLVNSFRFISLIK